MSNLNDIQRLVADTYENGEFAHITNEDEAGQTGDGLFKFLIAEAEDAETFEAYSDRLDTAQHQLATLQADVLKAMLAGAN